jgi:uncharacterized protein YkwD
MQGRAVERERARVSRLARRVIVILAIVMVTFVATHPAHSAIKTERSGRRVPATLLDLVNRTRQQHGLAPLRLNPQLSEWNRLHSLEMARHDKLFHTTDLGSFVRRFGATTWGENIGYANTLAQITQLWMASPVHRAHMLDPAFDHAGIGVVSDGGWFWVTMNMYG